MGGVFDKILVANRGEIALRVMRACRELGIKAVAVYGDGELDAPHVRYADEAYRIPSTRSLPYLDIAALIEVARAAGVQAIHPGYGFLAENPVFAEACLNTGLVFIGPPAEAIAAMGDKVAARRVALSVEAPVVPGSDGPVDIDGAHAFARDHGYPVAIKAAAGGGGRGFRVATSADELEEAFLGAAGEAERYFGDGRVYVERYLDHPRHVEMQVFADEHEQTVALGERDCSIQRRHQKLLEESPSPAIDQPTRAAMGETAVRLARAVGYRGAGTVEFLYQDGAYYFLEMNTRIQVEHPVTELVTGIDLVAEQIRVAMGAPLSFGSNLRPFGHAIECRINAEDPGRGFAPGPGLISAYRPPAGFGVRVDGAAEPGYQILPQYDSLIAKLVVWGRDRDEARARLMRALDDYRIEGVPTTIPFHRALVSHEAFASGDYDTGFLTQHPEVLNIPPTTSPAMQEDTDRADPETFVVEVGGKRFDVRLYTNDQASAPRRATRSSASAGNSRRHGSAPQTAASRSNPGQIVSPIQGTVLSVAVAAGDTVSAGDLICVVEAMKMENEITAPRNGVVGRVEVSAGQIVQIGALIAVVEAAD